MPGIYRKPVYRNPIKPGKHKQEEGLRSILITIGSIIGGVLFCVIALHVGVRFFVPRISFEKELQLRPMFSGIFKQEGSGYGSATYKLNELMERVVAGMRSRLSSSVPNVRAGILCVKEPNAFAFPGLQVGVTKGLIDALETEQELLVVLGHELGHILNRDTMAGLGDMATSGVIALVLQIANVSSAARVVDMSSQLTQLKFSRDQEIAADELGLRAIGALYQEAGAARAVFEVFEKLEKQTAKDYDSGMGTLFASHPMSADRTARIESAAAERGIAMTYTRKTSLKELRVAANQECPRFLMEDDT
jgi:Zn-dependent protease with chaperone function